MSDNQTEKSVTRKDADGNEVLALTIPTIFEDLNEKEGLDKNHKRSEIIIRRLKFKHFRKLSQLSEEKQMIYAISTLTDLSEDDIDELDAQDAGEVTRVIIGFMNSFMNLAQNMMPK